MPTLLLKGYNSCYGKEPGDGDLQEEDQLEAEKSDSQASLNTGATLLSW